MWDIQAVLSFSLMPVSGEYHLTLDDSVESPSGLGRLESDLFNTSEESCLEFWYHVPAGLNSTELRVLLRSAAMEVGETQLWSSSNSEGTDAWRQEFIPLGLSEMGMQVERPTINNRVHCEGVIQYTFLIQYTHLICCSLQSQEASKC